MVMRLALSLVVFLELIAAAVIAVALRYGRFDQGAGFYLYLVGPLTALSLAAGTALPHHVMRQLRIGVAGENHQAIVGHDRKLY